MFEVADAPRALLPKEKIWPAIAKWTRWTGAHRACEVCGRLVIQLGLAVAPRAQPARWRRKGPNGEMFVCTPHEQVLHPEDDRVEAEAQQRRELTELARTRRAAAGTGRPRKSTKRSELAS